MMNKIKKILNFWALLALWLNQLLVPMAVWAQEAEITPRIDSTEVESDVAQPTETPRIESEASDSDVASQDEEVEEVIETPNPTPTIEVIINDNEASVSAQTTAESQTGTNTAEASDSAQIDSGEAVAEANSENVINQNQEEAEVEVTAVEPIAGEIIVVIPKDIVNINEAELKNETEAEAGTGENQIVKTEVSAEITSGDAVAMANVINMVNTNIVGGKIGIYINNQFSGEKQDLDLNKMWQELAAQPEGEMSQETKQQISVFNLNQASIENWVTVMASTGMNVIGESDEAVIMTGSATALANVINLVNTNIFGDNIFFGILNINGALLADLILPAPTWFEGGSSQGGAITATSQNQAVIDNQVKADANTGDNSLSADQTGLIETGMAISLANSLSVVNQNINDDNFFYVTINNLGGGQGTIYNWSLPGAVELMPNAGGSFSNWTMGGAGGVGGMSVYNQNQAYLLNNINVSANTGGNTIKDSENGLIRTGAAMAVANLTNFVNLNLSGNNWFYGIINILGGWNGRVIFAYPDLAVQIEALDEEVNEGESLHYQVSYKNIGYDTAPKAELEVMLPEGTAYLSDDSGFVPEVSGRNIKWLLGDIKPGGGGSFVLEVATGVVTELAWWQKIVKPAVAAEVRIDAETRVVVRNKQVESDTNNNQAVASSKIIVSEEDGQVVVDINGENSSGEYDSRQAELVIEAKNNVVDGVYPGDVVTFEIEVENRAAVSAYDSYLRHEIYNEAGELYRWAEIDIGEIKANRSGKISFGVVITPKTQPGKYYSQTVIYAWDQNGAEIESNWSETEFGVKNKYGTVMAATGGLEAEGGEVAGAMDEVAGVISPDKDSWFLYAALLFESSVWIYHQADKWKKTRKVNIFEVFYLMFVVVSFVFSVVMLFSITALAQIKPF